jgi:hypothetical protein
MEHYRKIIHSFAEFDLEDGDVLEFVSSLGMAL